MNVGIIGGGISGVTLHRFLKHPSDVLEAAPVPGGLCGGPAALTTGSGRAHLTATGVLVGDSRQTTTASTAKFQHLLPGRRRLGARLRAARQSALRA